MAQRQPVLISGKLDYFAGIKDAYRPALFYRAPGLKASAASPPWQVLLPRMQARTFPSPLEAPLFAYRIEKYFSGVSGGGPAGRYFPA